MNRKLITLVAAATMTLLCQGAMAQAAAQAAPAAASSAAGHNDNTAGDRPAAVDEDKPQPAPRYSTAAKNAGASGTVVVMVQVGADDKAKSYHVMMSSGFKMLDDEAVRVLKSWSFKSAIKNGVPTDGYVQVPIAFEKH